MRMLRTLILTVLAVMFSSMLAFASSHDTAKVNTQSGIPLSPLQHGQILPIYDYYDAIIAVAERTEPTLTGAERTAFTEVLRFTTHTYDNAWWFNNSLSNMLFGQVLDSDTNPGHLPVHAYLRGAYELLARMQKADPLNPAISHLYDRVNLKMNGMMSLCVYSATPFNTAQIIGPDWSARTAPHLAVALGGVLLMVGMLNIRFIQRRQKPLLFAGQRLLA